MTKSVYQNIKSALVVDDNDDFRMLLQIKVQSLGIECVTAASGEAAIEAFKTRSFDLLITDFRMPGIDGVELLDYCRKNGIHIPVIFHSANADLAPREQIALSDCCATLMFKPINPEVFLAAIGAADNRSHHTDCIHFRNNPVE